MAQFLLPLLLVVVAVTGASIDNLCKRLTGQFNLLQKLMPLELDISFPDSLETDFINGPAKYRLTSSLTLPNPPCSVTDNGNSRHVTIKVNNNQAFIITPTRVLTVHQASYTLGLDVTLSKTGAYKKITVVDFSFYNERVIEDSLMISEINKNFVSQYVRDSLYEKLKRVLSVTFHRGKRVQVSGSKVRELMRDVFLATAQDF